jgi:hypothetical protein
MKHFGGRTRLSVLLVMLAVAAGGSAGATAGNGSKQMTSLKQQLASLKAQYTPAGIAKQLAATKKALDKYQNVDVAKEDGYAMASPCQFFAGGAGAESQDQGAMGVHFVNNAIMASGKNDPKKPPVLVYLPTAGGGFQLAAAEWFKPDADQNVATDSDRPTMFGRAFDGPMQGHAPGMPIHFDLHVWLWKHNPAGIFAPWNPDATCSA